LLVIGLALVKDPVAAAKCYLYSEGVGYACDTEPPPPVFARPSPLAGSFLPRTTYVRLHDNINVYGGPSLSSPVARNVGDGFLFSTVQGVVENEGQRWYMINQGEYVRSEDMHAVSISKFTGLEIKAQPARPFGWLLVDVKYSREPGAEPAEDTFWLPRYTFFEVYDAVVAEDEWIWYHIGGGRWIRQTEVSLVDVSAKPEEVGENDFWVEIDLYEQSFAAYEGRRMVFAGLVSSGLNRWPTHEGLFQVWSRQLRTKMSGAEGKVDYYFIEDVPHTMYFDNDIALHGAYWHDRFGYKHSHGCVNMPPLAAEWIFNWSAYAPTDLWVWVHISNPHHYFERFDPAATFAGP
jgi:hypothetical protein